MKRGPMNKRKSGETQGVFTSMRGPMQLAGILTLILLALTLLPNTPHGLTVYTPGTEAFQGSLMVTVIDAVTGVQPSNVHIKGVGLTGGAWDFCVGPTICPSTLFVPSTTPSGVTRQITLYEGTYAINASAFQTNYLESEFQQVSITRGGTTFLTIGLDKLPSGTGAGTIVINTQEAGTTTVAASLVYRIISGGRRIMGGTIPAGTATVQNVPPGTYTIEVADYRPVFLVPLRYAPATKTNVQVLAGTTTTVTIPVTKVS